MDSRLLKTAAFTSLAAIVLVAILVLAANKESVPQRSELPGESEAETTEGVPSVLESDPGFREFEKDGSFFDSEDPLEEAEQADGSTRLFLFATSVERDLRIQIQNIGGYLVTGEEFTVRIDGVGEFRDSDRNGIICVGELKAGDYPVELLPLEGYRVPDQSLETHVKDRVEYAFIPDISLLIHSADQVNMRQEDLQYRGSLEDGDGTDQRVLREGNETSQSGILVSSKQGSISWERAAEAGVRFAVIRAGFRGNESGVIVEDPFFKANMYEASLSGIPTGVFFRSCAVTAVEAVEEASAVIELVRDYPPDLPIFIDIEGCGGNTRADSLSVTQRTEICEAFCRTIQSEGYIAGVYAGLTQFHSKVRAEKLEKYVIAISESKDTPIYDGAYDFWHYTFEGEVDGIDGKVDLLTSFWKRK